MKTKTAKEVTEALRDIFETGRAPQYAIRSDSGTEFVNGSMKKLLGSKRIAHFITRGERKAACVERLIKTVRGKIFKHFLQMHNHKWVEVLQPLTEGYNGSRHSVIGFAPRNVTPANQELVRYTRRMIEERKNAPRPVKLKPVKKPKRLRPKLPKYLIGQTVRISLLKETFTREYSHRWTGELFKISSTYMRDANTPVYKLVDQLGDPIIGTFVEPRKTSRRRSIPD